MGEKGVDLKNTLDTVRSQVADAADSASKALDESIQAASYATKSGIGLAQEEYSHLRARSQVAATGHSADDRLGREYMSHTVYPVSMQSFLDTGYWHYKQTEEQVFAMLKGTPGVTVLWTPHAICRP